MSCPAQNQPACGGAATDSTAVHNSVSNYYGEVLKGSCDLQTNACTTGEKIPAFMKGLISNCHDDVIAKYYGCGLILPEKLEGMRVLDLGCGAGRDVYVLSQLVGEKGHVTGVDMTDSMLVTARATEAFHMEKFGYKTSNVDFKLGKIEELDLLELADNSYDVVVSNCVINLTPDKEAVFRQVFRVLKPGGEMYFSDVYSNRRIPKHLRDDEVLFGEGLSGGLYINDFYQVCRRIGFGDIRTVKRSPLLVHSQKLEEQTEGYVITSITHRLFKDAELELNKEDYGQVVMLRPDSDSRELFKLDMDYTFIKGKFVEVDGNTFRILKNGRYSSWFEFHGDFSRHYGPKLLA